jgi:hypothetical protein
MPSYAPITIHDQDVGVILKQNCWALWCNSDDLKWNGHIDNICKKAAKRLYRLRLLIREMLYLLTSWYQFTEPIFDPLLNMLVRCNITAFPSTSLKIILPGVDYAELTTLYERRTVLCNLFFFHIWCYSLTNRMSLSPENISKHTIWWLIPSCYFLGVELNVFQTVSSRQLLVFIITIKLSVDIVKVLFISLHNIFTCKYSIYQIFYSHTM